LNPFDENQKEMKQAEVNEDLQILGMNYTVEIVDDFQ